MSTFAMVAKFLKNVPLPGDELLTPPATPKTRPVIEPGNALGLWEAADDVATLPTLTLEPAVWPTWFDYDTPKPLIEPGNMLGLWEPEDSAECFEYSPGEALGLFLLEGAEVNEKLVTPLKDPKPPTHHAVQPEMAVHATPTATPAVEENIGLPAQRVNNNLPQPVANAATGGAGST